MKAVDHAAARIVSLVATRYRFLEGALVQRLYGLDDHLAILVDHLADSGLVTYASALIVVEMSSGEVAFIMTAEVSDWGTGTNNSHFLGSFDDSGHSNHGLGPWGDLEAFAARALDLACQRVGASEARLLSSC